MARREGEGIPERPRRVVVAGASGFVGRSLVEKLARDHEVVGLTRSHDLPRGTPEGTRGVRWRTADLYSLLELEHALEGADVAVYLVHSMSASAELMQGDFQDFDLFLADNFARAAKTCGVRHIVYLGGLIPDARPLSKHLASRLEVEQALAGRGIPVMAVRASIVIGPRGSSLRIVQNLVRRLPVMVAPAWAQQPTQPVSLSDVVEALAWCVGHLDEVEGRVAEVGGADVVSYEELMWRTARALGLRRRILHVNVFSPRLSKLWVAQVSQVPMALVSPLIDSLQHPMVVNDDWLQQRMGQKPQRLDAALMDALQDARPEKLEFPLPRLPTRRDVRSLQRLPLPRGWSAEDVAREYVRWLPRVFGPLLRSTLSEAGVFRVYLRGFRKPLLELAHSIDRSTLDRPLLYISGGSLARLGGRGRGRFEFRETLNGTLLASIHSFAPSLPWQFYKLTQARLHLWVMKAFAARLRELDRARTLPRQPALPEVEEAGVPTPA